MGWLRDHEAAAALLSFAVSRSAEGCQNKEAAEHFNVTASAISGRVRGLRSRGLIENSGKRYYPTGVGVEADFLLGQRGSASVNSGSSLVPYQPKGSLVVTPYGRLQFLDSLASFSAVAETDDREAARSCFVSFPSFQGGVGRTTAIAELGRRLARRGHRVALWDLNLYSPNLEDLDGFREVAGKSSGFAAFLEKAFASVEVGGLEEEFNEMLVEVPLGDSQNGGKLWLLPVQGSSPELIVARAASIGWEAFYLEERGRGYFLWNAIRSWLQHRIGSSEGPMSYILMDVPIGYSMLTKIAVVQMSDMVAPFCSLCSPALRRTAEGLRWLRNQHRSLHQRELPGCMVASLTPSDLGEFLARRKARAEQELGESIFGFFSKEFRGREATAAEGCEQAAKGFLSDYEQLVELIVSCNPKESSQRRDTAQRKVAFGLEPTLLVFLDEVGGRLSHMSGDKAMAELREGADDLRKEGKPIEAAILEAAAELSSRAQVELVDCLAELGANPTSYQVVEAFTYWLEDAEDWLEDAEVLEPLRAATDRMRNELAGNPWFWCARFSAVDERGDVRFAAECLRNAVSEQPVPLPRKSGEGEENPYRPGLDLDSDVFLGRKNTLKRLLGSSGVFALTAPKNHGRSWLLKRLETILDRSSPPNPAKFCP